MGNGSNILEMAYVFDKRLKYVGIDLEILRNDKIICEMAYIYGTRLKYLRYGISMLQMN